MPKLTNAARALALALALPSLALPSRAMAQTDFTRYVALGDSLTAGFHAGSLVRTAQANSYPALIARQAGTPDFQQPLVSEPGIPNELTLVSLIPITIARKPGQGGPVNLNLPRPYNNMAVPGADVADLVGTVSDNGGLHDLILRRQGATQLQQGLSLRPTFVTLWIGNNDVLGAATSGLVVDDVTLTTAAQFQPKFQAAVAAIVGSGAKLAIANIPDVTTIAFVTAVSRFVVNPATNAPVIVNGQPVPIIGPNGPLQAGDFVLLSATTELAQGRGIPAFLGGSGQPLSDSATLLASEVATIRARTQALNAIIRAGADQANAAFVDANAIFNEIAARGLHVGGITYSPAFLTGGIFSYDGVHPTPFGYAFIANEFIASINAKYNDDIPPVDLLPFVFGTSSPSNATGGLRNLSESLHSTVAGPPFIFTREAQESLRFALGVPTTAEIQRLRRRRHPQSPWQLNN